MVVRMCTHKRSLVFHLISHVRFLKEIWHLGVILDLCSPGHVLITFIEFYGL